MWLSTSFSAHFTFNVGSPELFLYSLYTFSTFRPRSLSPSLSPSLFFRLSLPLLFYSSLSFYFFPLSTFLFSFSESFISLTTSLSLFPASFHFFTLWYHYKSFPVWIWKSRMCCYSIFSSNMFWNHKLHIQIRSPCINVFFWTSPLACLSG